MLACLLHNSSYDHSMQSKNWEIFSYKMKKIRGNYFFPHELSACVILPPRTTTSTKREHQTTIFTHFAPFRQSNSCKNLNVLIQFQKWHKYLHLKKKMKEKGVAAWPPQNLGWPHGHPRSFLGWPWVACEPPLKVAPTTSGVARGHPGCWVATP